MARTVQEIQESQRILAEKQAQLKAAIASPDLGIRFEGQVARLQGLAALAEIESQAAALNLELNPSSGLVFYNKLTQQMHQSYPIVLNPSY